MKTIVSKHATALSKAACLLSLVVVPNCWPGANASGNWPQWRGPLQSGEAPGANPPTTWSESSNVKWKVRISGDGTGTPIIWGKMVFVQTAIPTGKKVEATGGGVPESQADQSFPRPGEPGRAANTANPDGPRGRGGMGGSKPTEAYQFTVLCLDRETGKEVWRRVAREEVPHEGARDGDGSFASSSGLTDGEHFFAYFGSRGFYSYDFKGGLNWKRDFGKMRIKMNFGEGSSPALYQDVLIVNWDNEDGSFITALDKNTGKSLWRENRDEGTTWATPLVIDHSGKVQVITAGSRKIRSYDLATGRIIWECKGLTANVIPSPVADGERVYCTSGFQGSALLAIRLDRTGDLTGTDAVAWSFRQNTPYVPSSLLYEGKLYFHRVNTPRLSCLEAATGKVLIDAEQIEGLGNMVYASPLAAAGRIYLTDRNGVTVVLKHSDRLERLATNKLEDKIDASPVAVEKELFLRGRNYLYCLSER